MTRIAYSRARPTAWTPKLQGGERLDDQHPAGPEGARTRGVDQGPDGRRKVDEYQHEGVVRSGLGTIRGQVVDLGLDGDPALSGEAPRLLEAHRGSIDCIHREALLGEPNRIAPLPFPQGKHAAAGPDVARTGLEPAVGRGPVREARGSVPFVPELEARAVRTHVAHGAIQPHLRKMAAPSFDWRKAMNSFASGRSLPRFVSAAPHER